MPWLSSMSQPCSSDSTAAASPTARRYSESIIRLRAPSAPESACDPAIGGNVFLGKVLPDSFPLLVRQSQHLYDCRQANS